ncbi:MAG: glycosyltransferase family 4 protein [Deltaproteobacteria bacterium]|nr:glycosyltransferase family 4 protein [Deltaproteobacteria bacterium]
MSGLPRIAHVCTIDLSLRYLLLNQLKYLQARGYDVVGISNPGPDVAFLEAQGIRHLPVPMTRAFSPTDDLRALQDLERVFRRERFDLVHTHNPKPGLLGQLAARAAGIPRVVNTLHGFYFHDRMPAGRRRFYILMEQIAASCSDAILSQNPEDLDTAVREHICRRADIEYLGNGIDLDRFDARRLNSERQSALRASLGIAEGAPVVGFVGRLVEEKGILELCEAMRAVRARIPSATLLVIGPTDIEKADALTPESLHSRYSLAEGVVYAGLRQDMPELYGLMDVFVLPSWREGFPRSPMEAAAMGKPVVVTDIRGCRETVTPGQTGLMTAVQDATALAAAILEVLADPARAGAWGRAGRELAERKFDERLVFERVAATYHRLGVQ